MFFGFLGFLELAFWFAVYRCESFDLIEPCARFLGGPIGAERAAPVFADDHVQTTDSLDTHFRLRRALSSALLDPRCRHKPSLIFVVAAAIC